MKIKRLLLLLSFLLPILVCSGYITCADIKLPVYVTISSLLFFTYFFDKGGSNVSRPTAILKVLICLIAVQTIFNHNHLFSINTIMLLIPGLIVYFAMSSMEIKDRISILKSMAAMGTVLAAIGIGQRYDMIPEWIIKFSSEGGKVVGLLGHKNDLATYLNAAIPITLVMATRNPAWMICAALQVFCVLISGCRAGILVLSVMVPIIGLWPLFKARKPWAKYISLVGVCLACIWGIGNYDIADTAMDTPNWSDQIRIDLWRGSMAMIKENYVGRGPGGFEKDFPLFKSEFLKSVPYHHYPSPMNIFLHYAVDYGIPGAVLFFCFVTCVIFSGAFRIYDDPARIRFTDFALFAPTISFLAIILHSVVDLSYDHPPISFLLFALAGHIAGSGGRTETKFNVSPLPYGANAFVAATMLLAVPLLSAYSWKAFTEIRSTIAGTKIERPVSLMGKYSQFEYSLKTQKPDNKLAIELTRNAPHFFYLDYLSSIYFTINGRVGAAKEAMRTFQRFHRIQPEMQEYMTWLNSQP